MIWTVRLQLFWKETVKLWLTGESWSSQDPGLKDTLEPCSQGWYKHINGWMCWNQDFGKSDLLVFVSTAEIQGCTTRFFIHMSAFRKACRSLVTLWRFGQPHKACWWQGYTGRLGQEPPGGVVVCPDASKAFRKLLGGGCVVKEHPSQAHRSG